MEKIANKIDIPRIIRFLFWGQLNTIISIAIFCGLMYCGLSIALANFAAIVCGILLGHAFNKKKVFRSNEDRTLRKYFLLWGLLYIISTGFILFLVHLGMNKYFSAVVSGIVLVPVSYVIQKAMIFKDV